MLSAYLLYSSWVYTQGTDTTKLMSASAENGKKIWQEGNCQNCHQLFGLGGYMGPDLTTVTADKNRGAAYAKAIILSGGNRMPNYHFKENEAEDIVAFLDHVSKVADNRQ